MGVSLPIRIFEPRSIVERISDIWGYAYEYLTKAAELSDPLERFKMVIAYGVCALHLITSIAKPFNPILGETYEGRFPDGTEVFCEHISHHPPITRFYIKN